MHRVHLSPPNAEPDNMDQGRCQIRRYKGGLVAERGMRCSSASDVGGAAKLGPPQAPDASMSAAEVACEKSGIPVLQSERLHLPLPIPPELAEDSDISACQWLVGHSIASGMVRRREGPTLMVARRPRAERQLRERPPHDFVKHLHGISRDKIFVGDCTEKDTLIEG